MLIDLTSFSPICIDPSRYPTTLVVEIDPPDDREPQCGVFAGRHRFDGNEAGQVVPVLKSDPYNDFKLYLLDRLPFESEDHIIHKWIYSALGYDTGIDVDLPYAYTLHLQAIKNVSGLDIPPWTWSVSIVGARESSRVSLILPDYEPGAVLRGAVTLAG